MPHMEKKPKQAKLYLPLAKQKPTDKTYQPDLTERPPESGTVPYFHPDPLLEEDAEALGQRHWQSYLRLLEKNRRTLAQEVATTSVQSDPYWKGQADQPLTILKKVADELGIPNDITEDGSYAGNTWVSPANPWLQQDEATKRAKVQRLITHISQRLHPSDPPGDGGNGDGQGQGQGQGSGGGGGGGSGGGGGEKKPPKQPSQQNPQNPQNPQNTQQPQKPSSQKSSGVPGRQPKPLSKEEKQAIHNQLAEDVQAGQSQDNSYRQQAAHEEAEKQEREMLLRRAAPTGGGDQFYGDHSQESIFTSIRRLLTKLAEEMDYSQVVDNGSHRWDPKQLLIGKWNPQRIPEAKKDYATRIDHIYLSLDTSGSVSAYTREIASMAAGAAGLVHLFTGTEGKPTNRVNRKTPLASPHSPFPEWRDQERLYGNSKYQERRQRFTQRFFEEWKELYPTLTGGCFEYWLAWMLELEKPKPGSRLIFWGDTEGVEFHAPRLLAHLVRKYRFAWLLSEGPEDDAHLTYWYHNKLDDPDYILAHADDFTRKEYHKLRLVGLPVIFNVTNAQGIQRAMQELQTRR